MPLLEGHAFFQVALVFALIGALGLVLKWTFSRDKRAPRWPTESPTHAPLPTWSALTPEPGPATDAPAGEGFASAAPAAAAVPSPQPEDYGLLASVAAVASAEEAARIRAVLVRAGIRATTTVGTDGRHRVLVFRTELHRARRVAGGT